MDFSYQTVYIGEEDSNRFMQVLKAGQFFGHHQRKWAFDDLVITETEYVHQEVDWHYHEHPYFTFLVKGRLFEANKKESYYLEPGALLFHHWDDGHYNRLVPGCYTQGFHIELTPNWFLRYDLPLDDWAGSQKIELPALRLQFEKIYQTSFWGTPDDEVTIQMLLIQLLTKGGDQIKTSGVRPDWVEKVRAFLHDNLSPFTLIELADSVGLHPVYLSRKFPVYFGCTLSVYRQQVQLLNSLQMMRQHEHKLSQLAYENLFSDQSHWNRVFKSYLGTTPARYRKKWKESVMI